MCNISTNGIVRTILISSFAVGLLIGAGGAYFILHERAIQRTAAEAGRLLSVATAVRGDIDQHIAPLLHLDDKLFHAETVPAFAAQAVYRTVQGNYPGYTYREPALNPANPNDLPPLFEVEPLNNFRANPDLKELAGVRDDAKGSV